MFHIDIITSPNTIYQAYIHGMGISMERYRVILKQAQLL
jgi:hypothetical protein